MIQFQTYSLSYLKMDELAWSYNSFSIHTREKHRKRTFKTFKWRACVHVIFESTNQRARLPQHLGADWLRAQRYFKTGRGALLMTHLKFEIL